ncbi:MAG: hypothetical protein LBS60_06265 [Deltaproteobacteria bacterium]|jgi:hypothetical protein|nr:hypothetical protein [Deltaproteobacteria bacterium]
MFRLSVPAPLFLMVVSLAMVIALAAVTPLAAQTPAAEESDQTETAPKAPLAPPNPAEPEVTLDLDPDDHPDMARFKAALRLLAGYNQVMSIAKACQLHEVWENYQNRNGRTFSRVFVALKSGGALDEKYRALVDESVKAVTRDAVKVGCEPSARDIDNGNWDLYKAPRFEVDYKLFTSK